MVLKTVLRWLPSKHTWLEERGCDVTSRPGLHMLENLHAKVVWCGRRRFIDWQRGVRGEATSSIKNGGVFGGRAKGHAKVVEVRSALSYRHSRYGRGFTVLNAKEDAESRMEFEHSTRCCFERLIEVRKKGREQCRSFAQTWTITGP